MKNEAIKIKREEKGLTQQELAEKVGRSRIHINQIEKGARQPSYPLLVLIADALGCSVGDFF